jgi:hypothetical protein
MSPSERDPIPEGRRPPECPGTCSCRLVCGQAVIDGRVNPAPSATTREAAAENERLREGGMQLDGVIRRLVDENEKLRHEVQARDDVIYHAAEHLRHALDVIAAYEDWITTSGGQ